MERQDKKGFLDHLQEKAVSRKLLVWLCCTVMLVLGNLTPEIYSYICLMYIGSQAAVDLLSVAKKKQ